ncbi:MAG: GH1 family beta-glucosidase [Faecalibacterium sp.]
MAIFPKDFVWGAATAAYQIEGAAGEGGKGPSIWDVFSHTPGKTARGETGDTACDSYHRWREDIALLRSMDLKAYRFSVAWTRIAPRGGTDWNDEGLAYYDALVDGLQEAGIEPYLTLYHWDLPQALQEKGGWQNEDTARAFAQYAAKLAQHFRGRVHQWFTFNEPACIVGMGYGTGQHAPGLQLPLEQQFTCWQNILYAHCLAAQAIRAADPENKVGFVSTGRICYPVSDAPEDVAAARALTFGCPDDDWTFTHQMAFDPLCLGRWPEDCGPRLAACIAAVPAHINAALPLGRPDMLGLNIYNGAPVRMEADGPRYVERPTGYPHTAMFWPVEPESLNWGPRLLGERYGLPMYITENGLSCTDKLYRDGGVHDADRIDFLARYLDSLSQGIRAGADVRGYFHWSLLDNYEWHSGYGERFGLVYMDYPTGRRIPKDSAAWYGQVAASNGQNI